MIRTILVLPELIILDASEDTSLNQGTKEARYDSTGFILDLKPKELSLSNDNETHDDLNNRDRYIEDEAKECSDSTTGETEI